MTEAFAHRGISVEHGLTPLTTGQNERQLVSDVLHAEGVGDKFGHHSGIGYEIYKRYVSHVQEPAAQPRDEFRQRSLVTNHLRNAEQRCLKRGSAARHHGRVGIGKQRIGLVACRHGRKRRNIRRVCQANMPEPADNR